jgi:hypothetical protein
LASGAFKRFGVLCVRCQLLLDVISLDFLLMLKYLVMHRPNVLRFQSQCVRWGSSRLQSLLFLREGCGFQEKTLRRARISIIQLVRLKAATIASGSRRSRKLWWTGRSERMLSPK